MTPRRAPRSTRHLRDATWPCTHVAAQAEAVALLAAPLAASLKIAVVGDATADAVRGALGRRPHIARVATARAALAGSSSPPREA